MNVRTVLGDVPADSLGIVDAHDHLFLASPRLPGEELDDPTAAAAELRAFAELGGGTLVQWTPYGMGRREEHLPALSRDTGVTIIAATGLHQAVHYHPDLLPDLGDDLAQLFVDELTTGWPTGGRAGMIKVAGGFHGLDPHARQVMTAAAEAHHATGAPIGVHLEHGTAALDVLDLLCDTLDVPPGRVILGHLNRSPDPWVHRKVAEAGAFLAFDGPSPAHHATDWRLLDALTDLADAGFSDRLLLGGDTTTASMRAATGGGPGVPFLLRALRPRMDQQLGTETTTAIFTTNPAKAFAWP